MYKANIKYIFVQRRLAEVAGSISCFV